MNRTLTPAETAQGFHEGLWKQRVTYCCNFCPWDTMYPDLIRPHVHAQHGFVENYIEVEVTRPLLANLVDPSGATIQTVSEKQLIPDL